MAFSSVEIEIDGKAAIGDTIAFTDTFGGSPTVYTWDFVSSRFAAFKVTTGATISADNNNFFVASQIDLPSFTVTFSGTTTTIEAKEHGHTISNVQVTGSVTVFSLISNVTPPSPVFDITSVSLSEATSTPCGNIKVTLTQQDGSPPYTWINPSGFTGLVADIPRTGLLTNITLQDNLSDQDSISVYIPGQLLTSNITNPISIVTNPGGSDATVTIFTENVDTALILTYTIGAQGGAEGTYQSSNVFSSVPDGDYTAYVRDQYGCMVQLDFTVDVAASIPRLIPYVKLHRHQSFTFIQQQAVPDGYSVFYNYENVSNNEWTLEYHLNQPYCQRVTEIDLRKIQFWTNYDQLSARLIDLSDDSIIKTYTISKVVSNIGFSSTDNVTIYDRGMGQTGIFFSDGRLPEYAKLGQDIVLTGVTPSGSFQIKQLIYDPLVSLVNPNVIVVDRVYNDPSSYAPATLDVTYNSKNYDEYEFEADFAGLTGGNYRVEVLIEDSLGEYQDAFFQSEPIEVSNDTQGQEHWHIINWSNNLYDGVNYDTGITHSLRFRGLTKVMYPAEINSMQNSRRQTEIISGSNKRVISVTLENAPNWIYEKLQNAATAKGDVYLDGMKVKTEEAFSDPDRKALNQTVWSSTALFSDINYNQTETSFSIDGDETNLIVNDDLLSVET